MPGGQRGDVGRGEVAPQPITVLHVLVDPDDATERRVAQSPTQLLGVPAGTDEKEQWRWSGRAAYSSRQALEQHVQALALDLHPPVPDDDASLEREPQRFTGLVLVSWSQRRTSSGFGIGASFSAGMR